MLYKIMKKKYVAKKCLVYLFPFGGNFTADSDNGCNRSGSADLKPLY